jgi:hypothetical protein
MRPAARWISVAALLGAAGAPGLFSAAPAWADSLATQVDAASWYWAEQAGVGPLPAGAPREASGVPAGDLGVSYTTDVDKVAALAFGVSSAPTGALFDAFTVTMPLDPAGHQLVPPNGAPVLVACPALDPVADGADPGALSAAPTQNTVECVDGKFDAGKSTWTFELASLATDWAAGVPANGVVIRPKPGDATQFNYAFLGKKDIKVVASYSAPVSPVTAPVAPPAGSGSGFVPAPSFDSGSVPVAPGQPVTPVAPQPQVMPPPAPVVAAPATAPAAAIQVDALRPSGSFWLALLGLGALLLLAGLVLGDPMDPIVLDARRRRFADVIRARAAARALATSDRPAVSPRPRHA